jgi:hypothetical protein
MGWLLSKFPIEVFQPKYFLTVTLRLAGCLFIWTSKTTHDQIYFVWILGLFTSCTVWNMNFSVSAVKRGLTLLLESIETWHPMRSNLFNFTFKHVNSVWHLTEYDFILDRSRTTSDPSPFYTWPIQNNFRPFPIFLILQGTDITIIVWTTCFNTLGHWNSMPIETSRKPEF